MAALFDKATSTVLPRPLSTHNLKWPSLSTTSPWGFVVGESDLRPVSYLVDDGSSDRDDHRGQGTRMGCWRCLWTGLYLLARHSAQSPTSTASVSSSSSPRRRRHRRRQRCLSFPPLFSYFFP
ncbi:hypothetical protein M404DRAFT_784976 [Pisolithus tinctorius Marx 270]|uniref:Uncharacterized protein n=1 Tax=Pisolithus tinctorius Marx 270 TaxID=870435 RepID=A0A0C3PR11_PISTI|nr:hypothetical protein M404DRAFT_784976 [Pisolithus tinctorius Marx 270]